MGRTKTKNYSQPDDYTCGPTSLKIALEILGVRKSLNSLIDLCQTSRNGTSVRKMVKAINKLGFSVLVMEWATLRHLQSALRYSSLKPRAIIVDYLYDLKENQEPHEDSGHYSTVASYSARDSRIVLFDPANEGRKKSFKWSDFQNRWYDFDYKRRKIQKRGRSFKLVKNWNNRLMFILAHDSKHLPKFKTPYAQVFTP